MTRVLLIDGDTAYRQTLAKALRRARYDVSECASAEDALAHLNSDPFDIILADLHLPGMSGMELLRVLGSRVPPAAVLILTAHVSIESAVDAIRCGARDYLIKSMRIQTLLERIDRCLHPLESPGESQVPNPTGESSTGLVGTSRAMRDLGKLILKVAPTSSTVLVSGETGTGKELVARGIHNAGPRRDRPFLSVNCSGIPETLLESHLYGYVRGAFTGADRDRQGLLEASGEGTLFLDEIGEMPQSLQPKLLRVLDAREFFPVGSAEPRPLSSRVVAATHRDLRAMVRDGRFREDLYLRLATLEVPITPLRERPEDLDVTARYLLQRIAKSMGRIAPALSPEALTALDLYPWPGNVRELANVLERAMIVSQTETIQLGDFPAFLSSRELPSGGALRTALRSFERAFLERAVDAHGGDKVKAAKTLGISVSSFYRKFGLDSRPSVRRPG